MANQQISVAHNGNTYILNFGRKLENLRGEAADALVEIVTDELVLPNGQKAGDYKDAKKAEYHAAVSGSHSSAKKHLNFNSERDFGIEWDALIGHLKAKINEVVNPIILARHKLSDRESRVIHMAAFNGHVGATFRIGSSLRRQRDDRCLYWLSIAHNRGHVGACYEMAAHLESRGNYVECLRCLVASADGGFDIALMNVFDPGLMLKVLKSSDGQLVHGMLDELATARSSSARYFQGILYILQDRQDLGIDILNAFSNEPRRPPQRSYVDEVHENQIKMIKNLVDGFLEDILSGIPPLNSLVDRCKKSNSISFDDYDEFLVSVERAIEAHLA